MKRIVVLISGSGSNLQAIIDHLQDQDYGTICAVISNRAEVMGLERAKKAGIDALTLSHKAFDSREAFDAALQEQIDIYEPDLVVLAGFMRILTPEFTRHYAGRMFNIHPSLLPLYKGLHTHRQALEAGDKRHGATVHFVTEELDGGPLLIQGVVPILESDSEDELASRVHQVEHKIYPMAVEWFCRGRVALENGRVILDDHPLERSGYRYELESC
ncbi:phosphoribosylglycinamide formyltransferase [Pokkaliibacter sp. CJK22405]|uniref:phosphoribosylglycinamide formyltransferase n=1 Tax=Pokkaliibacter sp. CJK22405 TaxID=3384615 RepID=UPI0039848C73